MAIEDIKNFLQIDDRVVTAGQPTEAQLRAVAEAEYEAVANLGLLDQTYSLPDEAGLAASLGLAYRHIPVQFGAPTVENLHAFVAVMDEWSTKRVLVHCAANYRASGFMAIYGEMRLGWTREKADSLIRKVWEPNATWQTFLGRCRTALIDRVGADAE